MTADILSHRCRDTASCKRRSIHPLLGPLRLAAATFCLVLACVCMPEEARATYLVFTMEVCQTGQADFEATWDGKDYGPRFLAEKLEQYGLKGTFFVNSLCPPSLTDRAVSNMRLLVSRGHDIELHPHPDVVDPSRPLLTMYSMAERRKILETAIHNIRRAGAPHPIAYRAADYAIDRKTLSLLPGLGIVMDSSIFPGDSRGDIQFSEDLVNRFVPIERVYELPITMLRRARFIGYAGMAALDIDKTIWQEQESALKQIAEHGLPVATYFINFTSFYHHIRATTPNEPHKVIAPNKENIRKLDNVMKFVTSDNRFKVVTARELWRLQQERPRELEGLSFVPYTGLWFTYVKAWKHFVGHSIDNKIVAMTPIVLMLSMSVGAWYLLKRRRYAVWKRPES
jgi:peptidoglycan/xylan/chitin deacetylase (PgdA/CDA1 family)